MPGSEHVSSIIDNLPGWAQIAANLGVFAAVLIAAAVGFLRRLYGKVLVGSEDVVAEATHMKELCTHLGNIAQALDRQADALEEVLKIMTAEARETDIEREVARRLKEKESRHA